MEIQFGIQNENINSYNMRRQIMKLCNIKPFFSCCYCGIKFNNTLYGIQHNETILLCCQLCYIVTNFSHLHSSMTMIGTSQLSQKEINKRTVEYVRKNKICPSIIEIDGEAKPLNLKPSKFFNDTQQFHNAKVFFNNNIDISALFYKEKQDNDLFDEIEENTIDIHQQRKTETTERITKWTNKNNQLMQSVKILEKHLFL